MFLKALETTFPLTSTCYLLACFFLGAHLRNTDVLPGKKGKRVEVKARIDNGGREGRKNSGEEEKAGDSEGK